MPTLLDRARHPYHGVDIHTSYPVQALWRISGLGAGISRCGYDEIGEDRIGYTSSRYSKVDDFMPAGMGGWLAGWLAGRSVGRLVLLCSCRLFHPIILVSFSVH